LRCYAVVEVGLRMRPPLPSRAERSRKEAKRGAGGADRNATAQGRHIEVGAARHLLPFYRPGIPMSSTPSENLPPHLENVQRLCPKVFLLRNPEHGWIEVHPQVHDGCCSDGRPRLDLSPGKEFTSADADEEPRA